MVPSDHHQHSHSHGHDHPHSHGAASPHPAQAAAWSILRMPVASRLLAAMAVSACLWAIVWLAAR
jgi:H+/gluconate symporter-like permease